MTLPAQLAKYDAILDLLVEQLVREIEQNAEKDRPAEVELSPEIRDVGERGNPT